MTSVADRAATRPAPAAWTRWYWPWALTLGIAGYAATPARWSQWALLAAAALLGVPELVCVARRQWWNTFSDWFWRLLDIVRFKPVWEWNAAQYFAFAGWIVLAVRADWQLWGDGWRLASAGTVLAVFLTWHLFGRWWR